MKEAIAETRRGKQPYRLQLSMCQDLKSSGGSHRSNTCSERLRGSVFRGIYLIHLVIKCFRNHLRKITQQTQKNLPSIKVSQ